MPDTDVYQSRERSQSTGRCPRSTPVWGSKPTVIIRPSGRNSARPRLECDLVLKMVKGIDAEYRSNDPLAHGRRSAEPRASRLSAPGSSHPPASDGKRQTRHANPSTAEGPKPIAGAAADLGYPLVEMFADESNQRRLDAGVVVLLVSSVITSGRCGRSLRFEPWRFWRAHDRTGAPVAATPVSLPRARSPSPG